ncbi:hypothetical protein Pmar_PMAR027417 [Perkinsus marinus ATCC 50983]|uniref:Uncharacterized protein n=1 Tax=Perkinsus marinus (strain ATCC 50983 / TXsc) TaxID=423536 RepID=C5KSI4_PERM5|nr:hypothetical protein Pmar_PMAR027417 [Perkinsus marinus ATCC 50983]EER12598.1 hypothetical protein Pmar_PMAR027417 [Perkinsus marinus ATCC 50983]|eukprot:XP_002780803.1 hypothetical protein Pmar_PMAR027417 [Perkinsus marinus ATCC 50983]
MALEIVKACQDSSNPNRSLMTKKTLVEQLRQWCLFSQCVDEEMEAEEEGDMAVECNADLVEGSSESRFPAGPAFEHTPRPLDPRDDDPASSDDS